MRYLSRTELRMRRLVCALVWSVSLVVPSTAFAFDNDLRLDKLGPPERVMVAYPDPKTDLVIERDPWAQERFVRFVSEFALALAPMPADLNATVGDAGFSIAFTPQMAFVHGRQKFSDGTKRDVWPIEGQLSDDKVLFLPTLHLRKGLPFSLQAATDVTYVSFSTMVAVSASVRWAIVEGFQWLPDLSVGAFVSTVIGTGALSLVSGGWDVGTSYRFPIAGAAEGGLYVGYQRMGLNATTSNIDFIPDAEDESNPFSDDNVFEPLPFGPVFNPKTQFNRVYFGAQVRHRILVVGIDAVSGWGSNEISASSLEGPVDASVFKLTGRLGITF